jgi:hypothetical protein
MPNQNGIRAIEVRLISKEGNNMSNARFGMVFSTTEDSHYFYDSGTGKVVSCNTQEKKFLEDILNNKISLKEACENNQEFAVLISEEKLFACPEEREFLIPSKEEFEELITGHCEQIILEVTEACNLRCEYCIYHEHHPEFRGFSNRNMTKEVALRSIDNVLRSYKKDRFALTFYGGEPLINYQLIKESILYTQKKYPNIKLDISFTTNLTLLRKEMIDFFKSLDNVYILCSLDGPKDFHDKYRKYVNGNGTFEEAIKGIQLLREHFYFEGDEEHTFAINCVVTPPYSKKNLDRLEYFFREELKLPKDVSVSYSYLDRGQMQVDLGSSGLIADDIGGKLEASPIEEWALDKIIKKEERQEELFSIISQDMLRVAKRLRADDGLIEKTYFHGNCVPGQRRIYVNVDGTYKVCERIGASPTLGNHISGYDIDKIYKEYYKDYVEYFKRICKNCWAQPMCSICYERTMDKDGIKKDVPDSVCMGSRRLIRDAFISYYRLYETDREKLEETLQKYEKARKEAEGIRQYEVYGESL